MAAPWRHQEHRRPSSLIHWAMESTCIKTDLFFLLTEELKKMKTILTKRALGPSLRASNSNDNYLKW